MAKVEIPTNFQIPDEISITFVREDFLETSNNYRIFFEICIGITFAFLGAMVELSSDNKPIPFLDKLCLVLFGAGGVTFFLLTRSNYKKAKAGTHTAKINLGSA
jgi:hypothetical protein